MIDETKQNPDDAALSNDDLGEVKEGTAERATSAAAGAVPAGKGGTNPLHNAVTEEGTEPPTKLP